MRKLIMIVLLTGCAHGLKAYQTELLEEMSAGTPKAKIQTEVGAPKRIDKNADGSETWVYRDRFGNCNVTFDRDVASAIDCGNLAEIERQRYRDTTDRVGAVNSGVKVEQKTVVNEK